jgi:hypothetical protein
MVGHTIVPLEARRAGPVIASGAPDVCSPIPLGAILGPLPPIGRFDEEQVVRWIVIGLAVAVLKDQHIHATQPVGQILATPNGPVTS